MRKLNQPESGVLSSKPSNLVTNLGGAALLALTTGIAGKADAATWDTPVELSAINTTTAHEGGAAPDSAGNLLYFSTTDGVNSSIKVLLSGASTPSDVSATDLSSYPEASAPQPNGSGSFLLYDPDSNDVIEVVDSSGGNYSSGSVSVAYASSDYSFNGAMTYDQNSGEIAFTNWDSPSFDIDYLDGTPIIDTASTDEYTPSLDSSHNRMFYVLDNSGTYEIWVTDLSGATPDEYVVDGFTPYYDQTGNRLYYAAVNGSTYDAYYMDEIVTASDPDEDGDGEAASVDCDDTDPAINSSADEECDGVDNNCDGSTDGADSIDVSTWYIDNDDDGVGGTTTQEACDQPSGYVATDGDCDDTDATKVDEADCATSSTRDPNCDLAVGDMMADEVEVEAGEVICDDAEDMSEGTSEMISGSGVYFDGENIRIAEGFGSEWEFTNADTNFRFAAAGLEVDAEDLVAPMSFGVVNLNANGATPPPSETGDECVPGSVDTEDESKILTMGYESGKYTLTGDHDLNITVSGAEWQGLEAQWSDVSSGQEGVVTAEECLDEENPDDTGGDSGDDTGPDDTGPVDTDDTAVIDDTDSEGDSAAETGWQDTGGNGEAPVCGCTYDPSTGAMIPLIVTAGFLATRRRRTTKVA